jgi:hypothetical protein
MGFHRRIINEDVTKKYLESNSLDVLYSSESLIFMDDISYEVFNYFNTKKTTEEILSLIDKENKQKV